MTPNFLLQWLLDDVMTRAWTAVAVVVVFISPTWADEASREAAFRDQLVPLLRTYCFECHGDAAGEGDVKLEKYTSVQQLSSDRKEWLRVLKQVQLGSMPPEEASPMDSATRARMK